MVFLLLWSNTLALECNYRLFFILMVYFKGLADILFGSMFCSLALYLSVKCPDTSALQAAAALYNGKAARPASPRETPDFTWCMWV